VQCPRRVESEESFNPISSNSLAVDHPARPKSEAAGPTGCGRSHS
jgi:hypothetical protein